MPKGVMVPVDDGWSDRFWSFVPSDSDEDGCVIWMGGTGAHGRANFSIHRRSYKASRVAMVLRHGQFDPELNVLHTCDNVLCVADAHLFLGTQAENMADMVEKKRSAKGEAHRAAVATEADVLYIIARIQNGDRFVDIARETKFSASLIRHIARGNSWTHLTGGTLRPLAKR